MGKIDIEKSESSLNQRDRENERKVWGKREIKVTEKGKIWEKNCYDGCTQRNEAHKYTEIALSCFTLF